MARGFQHVGGLRERGSSLFIPPGQPQAVAEPAQNRAPSGGVAGAGVVQSCTEVLARLDEAQGTPRPFCGPGPVMNRPRGQRRLLLVERDRGGFGMVVESPAGLPWEASVDVMVESNEGSSASHASARPCDPVENNG